MKKKIPCKGLRDPKSHLSLGQSCKTGLIIVPKPCLSPLCHLYHVHRNMSPRKKDANCGGLCNGRGQGGLAWFGGAVLFIGA